MQLSTAELGWEIDSRRLFIGNGPVSEGAPQIGNTEILTQHSDVLGVSSGYQYKGEAAGYAAETGTSASDPTVRTLQRKLDDFASVKDFGAKGDGTTNDTVAINRAFLELFSKQENAQVRRSLFFPAGVYLVDNTIKIPAYAKVYGDGKRSTIIRQTAVSPGFAFADSKQRLSPGMSPTYPSFIEINDISFESTQQGTVLEIANSQNCVLRRVGLIGSLSDAPTVIGTGESTVFIHSEQDTTRNIVFEQCDISNNVFGILADDDMQSILFNGCHFHSLFKGAQLGENLTGTGPKGLKITNSFFDDIFNAGIHAYDDISGIVSAYNYFADVGNSLNGVGNPTSDTVIFQGNGNASISDIFDRSDSDNESFLRINISGKSSYALNTPDGVYYGYHKTEAGKLATLTAGLTDTSTGLSFSSTDQTSTLIYYTATKGTDQRQGTLRITGSVLTDEYSETTDIGLVFSVPPISGNEITLNYTLDAGTDVTFKYRIERLT